MLLLQQEEEEREEDEEEEAMRSVGWGSWLEKKSKSNEKRFHQKTIVGIFSIYCLYLSFSSVNQFQLRQTFHLLFWKTHNQREEMHVSNSWLIPNFLFAHFKKQKRCTASSRVQPQVLPRQQRVRRSLRMIWSCVEEEAPGVRHIQQLLRILD